jgi:Ca-activated chloride channel family protein
MKWAQSSYFWLLVLIPVIIIFLIILRQWSQKKLKKIFGDKNVDKVSPHFSYRRWRLKIFFLCLGLFFLILSLARPQFGSRQEEMKSEGVEMMLLVDVSESMLANDINPSRLDQAKIEINHFIDSLVGHKIGLIAFAGSSTVLSPLTNDPLALKLYTDSLSPLSVSTQGTQFEKALFEAEQAFERGGTTEDSGRKASHVIVIFSDGEDQEGAALEKAKKLTEKGYRIFTISYGTEAGAKIPLRDNLGYLRGYKKDSTGQEVVTKVHGDFLKQLAEVGKGEALSFSADLSSIKYLVSRVNELEKAEFDSRIVTQYDEKFQVPLFLSLLCFLVYIWIHIRKSA